MCFWMLLKNLLWFKPILLLLSSFSIFLSKVKRRCHYSEQEFNITFQLEENMYTVYNVPTVPKFNI